MVSLQDLGVLVGCLDKDEDALVFQTMLVLLEVVPFPFPDKKHRLKG